MNDKWDYTCIPTYRVKACIKAHTDTKISSSGIRYITRVLCATLHEMIDIAINSMVNEKKYIVDDQHLQWSSSAIANILLCDVLSFDTVNSNPNLLINYMGGIKTDVVKNMNVIPCKKIKITKVAKELMMNMCLGHIFKIVTLLEASKPFLREKIIQVRTIKVLYSTWLALNGVDTKHIISFNELLSV